MIQQTYFFRFPEIQEVHVHFSYFISWFAKASCIQDASARRLLYSPFTKKLLKKLLNQKLI